LQSGCNATKKIDVKESIWTNISKDVPGKSKSLCFPAKMSMEQPEYGSDQQTWTRNTVTKYGLALSKIGVEQPNRDLTNKHGEGIL
jgi:hypothetical protein